MKLIDLSPRWMVLEAGGPKVGLTFNCPHCCETRLGVVFHHAGRSIEEDPYILAKHGAADSNHIWTISGSDFDNISLSPSVDASASGHWHGFITEGNVT